MPVRRTGLMHPRKPGPALQACRKCRSAARLLKEVRREQRVHSKLRNGGSTSDRQHREAGDQDTDMAAHTTLADSNTTHHQHCNTHQAALTNIVK